MRDIATQHLLPGTAYLRYRHCLNAKHELRVPKFIPLLDISDPYLLFPLQEALLKMPHHGQPHPSSVFGPMVWQEPAHIYQKRSYPGEIRIYHRAGGFADLQRWLGFLARYSHLSQTQIVRDEEHEAARDVRPRKVRMADEGRLARRVESLNLIDRQRA
jgi:hypothetical protein